MVEREKPTRALPLSRLLCAIALFATAALHSTNALADKTDDERKRAEQLFNDARAAVKREDYAAACPKFEESLKLARRAGTLFNLAQCEEHEGRLVSAMRYYKEGIVILEAGDPRLAPSKKQLALIEPRIPYLTINLASPLPAGGRVTVDGRQIDTVGVEFPVDPGTHEVRVLVPKHADEVKTIHIAQSVHESITMKIGDPISDSAVLATVLGPRRLGAIAALGVGGLGFIGAAITGGMVVSANSRMEGGCPDTVCRTADGYEASRQGKPLLIANTISWGVGIAGVGVGTLLLLVGNKKDPTKPQNAQSVIISPGFVGINGSF